MIVKFLVDYGEVKKGDIRNTKNDEDAQMLIDGGTAEKYVATDITEDEKEEQHQKIVDDVVAAVKTEIKEANKDHQKKLDIRVGDDENPSGFKSAGEFFQSVVNGKQDPKMVNYIDKAPEGLGELINADGGFLIPQEFSTALLTAISRAGVIAPKCQDFPSNNNLSLPFVNRSTEATSWTGGVTIYKPAEGVAKTASQPVFGQAQLKLNKLTALVYTTDELIQDSPVALQTFLTTMVSTEMALTKDEDIINGSGAGEALGVVNAPATVSVAKETGQPATTIEFANLLKMWSRMYSPSRSKAVWLINQDCMQQIMTASIEVGTGGAPVVVMNATTALPERIFGAPVIWSPHCQTLGTVGDIILGDFSQYVTISKLGRSMDVATSIHVKFTEDETCFRFVVRFDGQPWWASAVTPKHGSATVSPFVTLAARA